MNKVLVEFVPERDAMRLVAYEYAEFDDAPDCGHWQVLDIIEMPYARFTRNTIKRHLDRCKVTMLTENHEGEDFGRLRSIASKVHSIGEHARFDYHINQVTDW